MSRILSTQTPTNIGTTSVITVPTTTGFQAGDLVFYNGSTGSYGDIPVSAATSASFNANISQPYYGGTIGSNVYPSCGATGAYSLQSKGGTIGDYAAAQVGVTAQVWLDRVTGYPFIQLLNTPNGASSAIATVQISAVYSNTTTSNISVTPLSGGNFAVAWSSTSGGTAFSTNYAIYNTSGAAIKVATQDYGGTAVNSGVPVHVVALLNGGFVIAYATSVNTVLFRTYDSAGTAVSAWTTISNINTNATTFGITAMPSSGTYANGFAFFGCSTTANTGTYAIYNSSGAALVALTSFTGFYGNLILSVDCALCYDGISLVFTYIANISSALTVAFRTFNLSTATLGSEKFMPAANFGGSAVLTGGNTIKVLPLSLNTTNFVVAVQQTTPRCWTYMVFNTAGDAVSGTSGSVLNSNNAWPHPVIMARGTGTSFAFSMMEYNGYVYAYWMAEANLAFSQNMSILDVYNTNGYGYAPVNNAGAVNVAGTVTATPNAFAPNGSTPTRASFYTTTNTLPFAPTVGTTILSPTVIYNQAACNRLASCTLPDGRILVAYAVTSTTAINVAVYSATGTFIQSVSVIGSSNQTSFQLKIASLTSGKFVVAYSTSATNLSLALYESSTFTQIGTVQSITTQTISSSVTIYNVCAISDDRYAVVYLAPTTTYPTYQVFNNANVNLVAATTVASVVYSNVGISGNANGGFMFSGYDTVATLQKYATYTNTTGNTFSQILAPTSLGGGAFPVAGAPVVSGPGSYTFFVYATSGTAVSVGSYNQNFVNASIWTAAAGITFTNVTLQNVTLSTTGFGTPVLVGVNSSNAMTLYEYSTATATNLGTAFTSVAGAAGQPSISPSYGNNIALAYLNASGFPTISIVTAFAGRQSVTLTSGTNESVGIPIYPHTTATSPAITNTIFAGVAATTTSANENGQVIINGPAQLNTQYSASTAYQAFDYQQQGSIGVRGTIIGRQVNLQGNV
jgi:hypothetical protein